MTQFFNTIGNLFTYAVVIMVAVGTLEVLIQTIKDNKGEYKHLFSDIKAYFAEEEE